MGRTTTSRRVVLTGCGVVSPIGNDVTSFWTSLIAGRSGVAPITRFDASGIPVRIAGDVTGFDPSGYLPRPTARRLDRFALFAVAAADEAMRQAKLDFETDSEAASRVGVLIGSGYGPGTLLQNATRLLAGMGYEKLSPFLAAVAATDNAAYQVAAKVGAGGPTGAVSTACASGTTAIGEAASQIRGGVVDVMVAGGSDDPITPVDIAAAARAGALSRRNDDPQAASRPFDRGRDGFVMGAGAGIVVLESADHALARGAEILAELVGYGATTDSAQLTAPHPEGLGARRAMLRALDQAGVAPDEIDYVNAHGTSTKLNDAMEGAVIRSVLGGHAPRTPISSIKSMTGHMIGAAGAVEAITLVQTIRTGVVPPTINCVDPEDPELDYVPGTARRHAVDTAMSNSFGFGGHNAVVILKRWRD